MKGLCNVKGVAYINETRENYIPVNNPVFPRFSPVFQGITEVLRPFMKHNLYIIYNSIHLSPRPEYLQHDLKGVFVAAVCAGR